MSWVSHQRSEAHLRLGHGRQSSYDRPRQKHLPNSPVSSETWKLTARDSGMPALATMGDAGGQTDRDGSHAVFFASGMNQGVGVSA